MKFPVSSLLLLGISLISACQAFPSPSKREIQFSEHSEANVTLSRRGWGEGAERPVWVVLDVRSQGTEGIPLTRKNYQGPTFATHGQICLGGTEEDPPMNVQIDSADDRESNFALWARYGSERNANRREPFATPLRNADGRWVRHVYKIEAETGIRNEHLVNPFNGDGLASLIWSFQNQINMGGHDPRTLGPLLQSSYPPGPYQGDTTPLMLLWRVLHQNEFFFPGWHMDYNLLEALKNADHYWMSQPRRIHQTAGVLFTLPAEPQPILAFLNNPENWGEEGPLFYGTYPRNDEDLLLNP